MAPTNFFRVRAQQQAASLFGTAVVCALFNLNGGGWPFVLSAGVLKHSAELQLTGASVAPHFVALVPADGPLSLSENMTRALSLQGWRVRAVPYLAELESKMHKRFGAGHRYHYTTGMKIHAFGLPYRRVLYCDVDSAFDAAQKLGSPGCFAELMRMPMGDCLAAAPYDAQKTLLQIGETEWRRRARDLGYAHGRVLRADMTLMGGQDYHMMLTGLMLIRPDKALMADMIRALQPAKNLYSDGDALTHAVTAAGIARGSCAWMGIDVAYGAYRAAAKNPYAVQFGGTPPWLLDRGAESAQLWRAALQSLLRNSPHLATFYHGTWTP